MVLAGPGINSISSQDHAGQEQRRGGNPLDIIPVHGVQRQQRADADDVADVTYDERLVGRVTPDSSAVLQRLRVAKGHDAGDPGADCRG